MRNIKIQLSNSILKALAAVLLLSGLYSLSATADNAKQDPAQSGETKQATNTNNTEIIEIIEDTNNQQQTAEPTANNEGQTQGSRKVFIPSEQVSEDLAVSFPVDI